MHYKTQESVFLVRYLRFNFGSRFIKVGPLECKKLPLCLSPRPWAEVKSKPLYVEKDDGSYEMIYSMITDIKIVIGHRRCKPF